MIVRSLVLLMLLQTGYVIPAYSNSYWAAGGVPVSLGDHAVLDIVAVPDGQGGLVVVWSDDGSAQSQAGIYIQTIDAEADLGYGGVPIRIPANPSTESLQLVASAPGFNLSWVDATTSEIYVASFDPGVLLPVWLSLQVYGDNVQLHKSGSDHTLLAWRDASHDPPAIYAQKLDEYRIAAWQWGGVKVSGADEGRSPFVVPDDVGGAIVVWEQPEWDAGGQTILRWNVVGTAIDASGLAAPVFDILTGTLDADLYALALPYGEAFVLQAQDNTTLRAQRVDDAGQRLWANGALAGISITIGPGASKPAIALSDNSNILVAFEQVSGSTYQILAQQVKVHDGARSWSSSGVVVSPGYDDPPPFLSASNLETAFSSGALIAWEAQTSTPLPGSQVYVQALDAGGSRFWSEEVQLTSGSCAGCTAAYPLVMEEAGGGAYVMWREPVLSGGAVIASRVTRASVPDVVPTFDGGGPEETHYWDVSITFDMAGGPTEARVYHGPRGLVVPSCLAFDCPSLGLLSTSSPSVSHSILLDDGSPTAQPHGNLDPTPAYCYRIVPGGMPVYEGALDLDVSPTLPVDLHLEGAAVTASAGCDTLDFAEGEECFQLHENGTQFFGALAGYPLHLECPSVTGSTSRLGGESIEFKVDAQPVSSDANCYIDISELCEELQLSEEECDSSFCHKQRVEATFVEAIPFYETRYDGFSFMVDAASDTLRGYHPSPANPGGGNGKPGGRFCTIRQWWQDPAADGNALNVDIRNTTEGPWRLQLWRADANSCEGDMIDDIDIVPGEWTDVVVGYRFDPTGGCGWAKMWVNGIQIAAYEHDPTAEDFGIGVPSEPWADCASEWKTKSDDIRQHVRYNRFGIYRLAQNGNLKIYFDELKHSDQVDDVITPPEVTVTGVAYTDPPGPSQLLATISFETVPAVSAVVEHGPTTAYGNTTVVGAASSHSVPMPQAVAGATYYYRITVDGASEIDGTSAGIASVTGQFTPPLPCPRCPDPFGADKKTPPARTELIGNAPNPFNPRTTIEFATVGSGHVALKVYDVSGRLVRTLADEGLPAGIHSRVWDSKDDHGVSVASGVYFYRLTADGKTFTQKMMLLK